MVSLCVLALWIVVSLIDVGKTVWDYCLRFWYEWGCCCAFWFRFLQVLMSWLPPLS